MNTAEFNICVDQHSDAVYRFILKNIRDEDYQWVWWNSNAHWAIIFGYGDATAPRERREIYELAVELIRPSQLPTLRQLEAAEQGIAVIARWKPGQTVLEEVIFPRIVVVKPFIVG